MHKILNLLDKYYQYFLSLGRTKRLLLLFSFFLIGNIFQSYIIYLNDNPPEGYLTRHEKGDAKDYTAMSETLKETGVYGFIDKDGKPEPTFYRMPGFAFYYFPLTCLLGKQAAANSVVILQIIVSAFTRALVIEILLIYSIGVLVFGLGVILILLSNPVTTFNNILMTEAIASSLVLIVVYLLLQIDKERSSGIKVIMLAGFLFSWVIFLRPFFIVFYIIIFAYLFFIYGSSERYIRLLKTFFYFLFPFILMESTWVVRNYLQFDRFIPLESSIMGTYCNSPKCKARQLIQHMGGVYTEWSTSTAGTWFQKESFLKEHNIARPSDNIFPSYIFTDGLTIDSLRVVQAAILNSENPSVSADSLVIAEANAVRILEKFDYALKKNHWFIYYVYSRWSSVQDSFYQPASFYKSTRYPFNVLLTFINACASILLLTLGGIFTLFIAVMSIFKRRIKKEFILLIGFPILLSFIMNLVLLDHESRAILTVYYLIAIVSLIGLHKLVTFSTAKYTSTIMSLLIGGGVIFLGLAYTLRAIKF